MISNRLSFSSVVLLSILCLTSASRAQHMVPGLTGVMRWEVQTPDLIYAFGTVNKTSSRLDVTTNGGETWQTFGSWSTVTSYDPIFHSSFVLVCLRGNLRDRCVASVRLEEGEMEVYRYSRDGILMIGGDSSNSTSLDIMDAAWLNDSSFVFITGGPAGMGYVITPRMGVQSQNSTTWGTPLPKVYAFGMSSDRIILAGAGDTLYRSIDTMRSWTPIRAGIVNDIKSISGKWYLRTTTGLEMSEDNGDSWRVISTKNGAYTVSDRGEVIIATRDTIWRSASEGKWWDVVFALDSNKSHSFPSIQAVDNRIYFQSHTEGRPDTLFWIESPMAVKKDRATPSLRVWPNPSTSTFTIETPPDISEIAIYDMLGREVYSVKHTLPTEQITLDVPAGIYTLRSGTSTTRIVIKR